MALGVEFGVQATNVKMLNCPSPLLPGVRVVAVVPGGTVTSEKRDPPGAAFSTEPGSTVGQFETKAAVGNGVGVAEERMMGVAVGIPVALDVDVAHAARVISATKDALMKPY